MKTFLPRAAARFAVVALAGAVLAATTGGALAAYDPANPPYPDDPNDVATLTIFDATTGAVVTGGSTATALSNYLFVADTDFNPGKTRAALSGFLAEAGKDPGAFSGQALGASYTYSPAPAAEPANIESLTNPRAKGGTTNTFDGLATAYPNTATSTSDFFQLYQLRIKTTLPTPQSTTYASADIKIDKAGGTWTQVRPAPAPVITAPGAPTGVTATAGNAQATVSFTAPADNGGAPITSYTVSCTPSCTPVGSTGSPITVTGLTNGTAYTFTVTAANSAGTGPASAASNSVTPTAPVAPGAPTNVVATAGNAQATITFTAPSNGGAAITSYTVTCTPACPPVKTGASSPITVSGLTNGTSYTFTVKATNSAGTGPDSAASNAVTPTAVAAQTGTFTPLPTVRIFDQTVGTTQTAVQIHGRGGVPDTATAVVVNVEVFNPSTASYVRITPFGQDAQVATQQYARGEAISNLVVSKVVAGKIQVKVNAGTGRILMDVAGYYSDEAGSNYTPLTTARTFDGQVGTTPVQVQISGRTNVPAGATAVAVNVEVFNPTASSYVRVTPKGLDPQVATQQFVRGQAISNLVIAQLVDGKIQVKVNAGSARVLMDVAGYYSNTGGSTFTPLATQRTFDGQVGTTQVGVQITGRTNVPADATAVVVNVEVFAPTAASYIRVTPFGQDAQVATQQYRRGQAISNLVVAKIVNGKIQVKVNAGSGRVLMDVAGYYSD